MYNRYLAHHGILGQKWGVRRYQNSDGSLTPAGKKRYESSDPNNKNNSKSKKKKRTIYGMISQNGKITMKELDKMAKRRANYTKAFVSLVSVSLAIDQISRARHK